MTVKYSLIVPAFNEQEVLNIAYPRLKKVMESLDNGYEIIFINDGSRDNTLNILKSLAKKDYSIKVISFSRNFGHQEAVSAGIKNASGQAIIIIDADLQDPPEVIPKMIEKWKDGADIVYGKRIKRKGESVFKRATAWGYYRFLRLMGGQIVPPDAGDFRVIDKKIVELLNEMPERNRFLRGMVAWAGYKSQAFEYVREERAAGKTKYPLKRMLKLAGDGITSFSNRPLKIPLVIGSIICPLATVYFIAAIVFWALNIWSFEHILFSIMFMLIAGVFISLGIFGMYLGRIYDESKARPVYIIDEKINF